MTLALVRCCTIFVKAFRSTEELHCFDGNEGYFLQIKFGRERNCFSPKLISSPRSGEEDM